MRVLIIILFLVMEFFCSEANALESSGDSISKSTFQRFQLGTSSEVIYFNRFYSKKLIFRLPATFLTAVSERKKIVLNTTVTLFFKSQYERFVYKPAFDFRFSYWYRIFRYKGFYFSTSFCYSISVLGSRLDKIPIFNLIPKPLEYRRSDYFLSSGIGYGKKINSRLNVFAFWEPIGGPFVYSRHIRPQSLYPSEFSIPVFWFAPSNLFVQLTFDL